MVSYDQLEGIYAIDCSSYYLLDTQRLKENYVRMHRAFVSRYEHVIIGYSYKTNYVPYLCQTLHSLGAYAEVVSRLEYDLALKLGVDPTHIILNGPLKLADDIQVALERQSIINLDSFSEIEWVKRFAQKHPDREVQIGLRVNFDLRENGVSPMQNGYEVSRFGFCVENGNFHKALELLRNQPNIQIVGLHGHFSTNRKLAVYERITRQLSQLAKQYLPDQLRYLDIGGGMYGDIPDTFGLTDVPTYDNYAEVICSVMREEFGTAESMPALILEPGISLVGDTFEFVCKVVDVKENRGTPFVLVDGSVHNIKPTMHRYSLPVRIISRHEPKEIKSYHVVGYTCMEKDYLLQNHQGPLPAPGDFLVFRQVGAYTIVFNPPFIRERPPIYAQVDQTVLPVRKKETLLQFLPEELYLFPHHT